MTNKAFRIQPPYRGQPLDVAYLYEVVDSMSALADSVAEDSFTQFAYKNQIQTVVSNLGIEAGQLAITKPSGNNARFTYTFKTPFKEKPVVSTTVEQLQGKGHLVQTSIAAIDSSSVTFNTVWETASPPAAATIHIVAIGIRRKQ